MYSSLQDETAKIHPRQQGSLLLTLLADDLTGACDSAVAFAQRGLPTEVGLVANALPSQDTKVWARSSESRDIAPEALKARLASELSRLPVSQTLFKKIDSVFRGNTFLEIEQTLQLFPKHIALLAPAFPAAGRTSRGGKLLVEDVSGRRDIDVCASMRQLNIPVFHLQAGLSTRELKQQLGEAERLGVRLIHCDAWHQQHLEALVSASAAIESPLIWMGAAGLAHAWATVQQETFGFPRPGAWQGVTGEVVLFIGSNHPVTLAQVAQLRRQFSEANHTHIVPIERGKTSEAEIQALMMQLEDAKPSCLLMTGGDTAALVCSALGVTKLRLAQEFAPGLPLGFAVGGPFEETPIVLKSGGFGDTDVLCKLVSAFTA